MIARVARSGLWVAAAAVCALPLAAFVSRPAPLLLTGAAAGLALLSAWNAGHALLVVAALGPLAGAIQPLAGLTYPAEALLEAMVLLVLGGAAVGAAIRHSRVLATPFEWAVAAFMAVAGASLVAQFPVAVLRAGASDPSGTLRSLILVEYPLRPPGLPALWQTALLAEGAALAALAARTASSADPVMLARAVVLGGAGAAVLNLIRLLEIALRSPPFLETLWWALGHLRFNTQYGDLNAAGSFFATITVLCVSQAGRKSPAAAVDLLLLPVLGCALWVTGSRVALVSTLLGSAGVLALRRTGWSFGWVRWRTVVPAVAALGAVFAAALFLFPVTRHGSFSYSLSTRLELLGIGARMLRDRPLFGVGTSQFYEQFPRYASAELLRSFQETTGKVILHENAHNQFLQILTELGIVGFACFAAVLVLALRFRRDAATAWRTGVLAALAAFILTGLAGHPLLTPAVAYTFWILLGLAASAAPPCGQAAAVWLPRAAAALLVLLALAVPARWATERRHADLEGVTLGLSGWQQDAGGLRFQWAGTRATFFVSSSADLVRVPLRAGDGAARRVTIWLDGRRAAGVVVPGDAWLDVNLPLPASAGAPAFRRIDVIVDDGAAAAGPGRVLMVGRRVERIR